MFLTIVPNIILLAREDFYNLIKMGDYCSMVDKPIGCSKNDDEMECIRGKHANLDGNIFWVYSILCRHAHHV